MSSLFSGVLELFYWLQVRARSNHISPTDVTDLSQCVLQIVFHLIKVIFGIALRIPTAHDVRVISART